MIVHANYPHEPGTLYDCPGCEENCYCTDQYECIHCHTREILAMTYEPPSEYESDPEPSGFDDPTWGEPPF